MDIIVEAEVQGSTEKQDDKSVEKWDQTVQQDDINDKSVEKGDGTV